MEHARRQRTNPIYPAELFKQRPNTDWPPQQWVFHLNRELGIKEDQESPPRPASKRSMIFLVALDSRLSLTEGVVPAKMNRLWAVPGRNDDLIWQGGQAWHRSVVFDISRKGDTPHLLLMGGNELIVADNWPDQFGQTLVLRSPDAAGLGGDYRLVPLKENLKGVAMTGEQARASLKAVLVYTTASYPRLYLDHFKPEKEDRARTLIGFGRQLLWSHDFLHLRQALGYFKEAMECGTEAETREFAQAQIQLTHRLLMAEERVKAAEEVATAYELATKAAETAAKKAKATAKSAAEAAQAAEDAAKAAVSLDQLNMNLSRMADTFADWRQKLDSVAQPQDPFPHPQWSNRDLLRLGTALMLPDELHIDARKRFDSSVDSAAVHSTREGAQICQKEAWAKTEKALESRPADTGLQYEELEALLGYVNAGTLLEADKAGLEKMQLALDEARTIHGALMSYLKESWRLLYPDTGRPPVTPSAAASGLTGAAACMEDKDSIRPDLSILERLLNPQKTEINELQQELQKQMSAKTQKPAGAEGSTPEGVGE